MLVSDLTMIKKFAVLGGHHRLYNYKLTTHVSKSFCISLMKVPSAEMLY